MNRANGTGRAEGRKTSTSRLARRHQHLHDVAHARVVERFLGVVQRVARRDERSWIEHAAREPVDRNPEITATRTNQRDLVDDERREIERRWRRDRRL